jgi:hypothetical protein
VAGAEVPDRTTSPWHPYEVASEAVADLVLTALEQDEAS